MILWSPRESASIWGELRDLAVKRWRGFHWKAASREPKNFFGLGLGTPRFNLWCYQ